MKASGGGVSGKRVREMDRIAIERYGVPGIVLMENAGRGAADAIERFMAALDGRRVAIIAGGGNNGGDGFVIARHLSLRGANVTVLIAADESKITGDAAVNLQILRKLGEVVVQFDRKVADSDMLRGFDLVVDALCGTGMSGPPRGIAAEAVAAINSSGRPVVAVDVPTGLDCDSGLPHGEAVRADMTVTFVAVKKGFLAPGASQWTGRVVVADIGVGFDENA